MVNEQYLTAIYNEFIDLRKTHKNAIYILAGDFNIPDVDWQNLTVRAGDQYPLRVSQGPVVQS